MTNKALALLCAQLLAIQNLGAWGMRGHTLANLAAVEAMKYVPAALLYLEDPWQATLKHSLDSRNFVEDVYRLDLRGAFQKKDDPEARELVCKRMAAGAAFLRDLAYTAWIDSAKPVPPLKSIDLPENPDNPKYTPATVRPRRSEGPGAAWPIRWLCRAHDSESTILVPHAGYDAGFSAHAPVPVPARRNDSSGQPAWKCGS